MEYLDYEGLLRYNALIHEEINTLSDIIDEKATKEDVLFKSKCISQSNKGYFLKKDGTIGGDSSSSSFIREFEISDSGTYYVTGRQSADSEGCLVAYYNESKQFISYETNNPGNRTENYKLTVPSSTKYVKITGNTNTPPQLQSFSVGYEIEKIEEDITPSGEISPLTIQENSYLLQDGTYTTTTGAFVIKTYKNNFYSKLIASGRIGNDSQGCSVCYYDKYYKFIGFEKPFTETAENYSNYYLTVPSNTYYIKICGRQSSTSLFGTLTIDGCFGTVQNIGFDIEDLNNLSLSSLKGKTIAIIGASSDTHGNDGTDCNAVEITIGSEDVGKTLSAYITAEDVSAGLSIAGTTYTNSDIGNEVTFVPTSSDIGKKIGLPNNYNSNDLKVWWMYVKEMFGCNIIPVCWSGAGYTTNRQTSSSKTYYTSQAWHEAQIRKCGIRTPGTMNRTAPDIIILDRGLNDITHTPYARITSDYFNSYNWQYPSTDKDANDNFGFLEGISLTIKKLREAYPFTPIVLATNTPCKRVNNEHYPINNGLFSLPQYDDAIRRAADFFGCQLIDKSKCAITYENMYPTYIDDNSSTPTHPNKKGHEVIGKFVVSQLAKMNFEV